MNKALMGIDDSDRRAADALRYEIGTFCTAVTNDIFFISLTIARSTVVRRDADGDGERDGDENGVRRARGEERWRFPVGDAEHVEDGLSCD